MNPEQIEQIIRELLKTGEFLASSGFSLAVKQIYLSAYLDFAWAILFVIVSAFSWKYALILKKKGDDADYPSEDLYYIGSTSAMIIGGILFPIISTILITTAIGYLANPQWFAVKLLLETFIK